MFLKKFGANIYYLEILENYYIRKKLIYDGHHHKKEDQENENLNDNDENKIERQKRNLNNNEENNSKIRVIYNDEEYLGIFEIDFKLISLLIIFKIIIT